MKKVHQAYTYTEVRVSRRFNEMKATMDTIEAHNCDQLEGGVILSMLLNFPFTFLREGL